ncbi:MAG: leucyl aminopeptidase [Spirochaetota bacterium]|nr:leucyl aminopeptidase [Spirochaetota bacterium]
MDKEIPEDLSYIKENIDLKLFKGKSKEILFLPFKEFPNTVIVGLGKKDEITRETLRCVASPVVDVCRKRNIKSVNIVMPPVGVVDPLSILITLAEGIYLSNYVFDKYKSNEENSVVPLERADFCYEKSKAVTKLLKEIEIISENTILCRNMINENSEKCNPQEMVKEARKIARMKSVNCQVLGKRDLEKLKMGLLLAVSQGSKYPPQLVILDYKGDPNSNKKVAIVGKGITFDSGGINLKSSGHIENMKQDMSGAAVCLYTIKAAAELNIKKNIVAILPLCENMISNTSYKPGEVIVAHNGKSVEIGNTDAEGRLILADAISFTEETIKPNYIIDIATLTGACLICFGEQIAGMLSNNDKLAELIIKAGEMTGDRVWRLPLLKEYNEDMKSDFADIRNVSSSRNAGTIMGAVFLKSFIKNTPWAHIDIAGTAWFSKQRDYRPKYATGYGVRLFIEMLNCIDV